MKCIAGRPGELLKPADFEKVGTELRKKWGNGIVDKDLLSSALYPKEYDEYRAFHDEYGPVDCLPTPVFFCGARIADGFMVDIEKGKTLTIKLMTIGELDKQTGKREVFFELNGQLRSILVQDKTSKSEVKLRPKADKNVQGIFSPSLAPGKNP